MNNKIIQDTWGSDHRPVIVKIKYTPKGYRKRSFKVSSWRTDWQKYVKGLRGREKKLNEKKYMEGNEDVRYKIICGIMKEEVKKA